MIEKTGRRITITCREVSNTGDYDGNRDNDEIYKIWGVLLDDGRLLTYGTGVDGADSLWSCLENYAPNGLASYESHEIHDETCSVDLETLRAADKDNVAWGNDRSCLTAEERPRG